MAEFEPFAQPSFNHEKVEVKSLPSHTNELSGGDSVHRYAKSQDRHPPNGLNRISSETNGLIDHAHDVSAKNESLINEVINLEKGSDVGPLEVCSNAIACQSSCEHSCDSKSDRCISDLESDVRLLNIQDDVSKDIDHYNGIEYVVYKSELQMPDIMRLITKDLSEPYSIYTYRYFIHNWPRLCFLAMDQDKCVGAIVCKLDMHKKMVRRGYIAMLAVDSEYRRKKIGSHLVLKAIKAMMTDDCDEVVLETEITNQAALRLYENLGFVRDKRLFRYYLNGVDALRLKLWLR